MATETEGNPVDSPSPIKLLNEFARRNKVSRSASIFQGRNFSRRFFSIINWKTNRVPHIRNSSPFDFVSAKKSISAPIEASNRPNAPQRRSPSKIKRNFSRRKSNVKINLSVKSVSLRQDETEENSPFFFLQHRPRRAFF